RIDSGVEASQRERFDLANLVQEVAADGDFEAQAHEREVKVVQADACTMFGVPEMLRSAIENVVRNAIRHTLPETTVELTLRKVEGAPKALLKVQDRGSGVPDRFLKEIFVPFQRVFDQDEANAAQGSGLGLAIAERAVRMHDGSIS